MFLECDTQRAEMFYTLDGSYPAEWNRSVMVNNMTLKSSNCFKFDGLDFSYSHSCPGLHSIRCMQVSQVVTKRPFSLLLNFGVACDEEYRHK